jgi:hypothetical protein
MHKGSSRRKMRAAISCKQLDFDLHPFSQKSKGSDETVETDVSTIGPPLSNNPPKVDRLFVPLATQPFVWFSSGQKKWELRRFGRQYTPKHVRVGRRVELRRGYGGREVIWGKVLDVVEADGVDDFFNKVNYKEVVPVANSREDAIKIAIEILKIDPKTRLLGFAVGHP